MALWDEMFEGNLGAGLAVGLGAAVLGQVLLPAMGGVLRPAAKGLIKAGLFTYERGREAVAHLNDLTGDIVAEARAELDGAEPAGPARPPRTRTRERSADSAVIEP